MDAAKRDARAALGALTSRAVRGLTVIVLDDAEWLARQYETRSASAIARELAVCPDTVLRALRLCGIPVRRRGAGRSACPELDDADWLTERHRHATPATIAAELGVGVSTVKRALQLHQIPTRDRSMGQRFRSPPELHDNRWLRVEHATKSATVIAHELGVSKTAVLDALRRFGIDTGAPWVKRLPRRISRPSPTRLERLWNEEGSYKGVAVRLGVSHPTAAVWLADVGIFLREAPVIARRDLERAIRAGRSIREIAADHGVADRTVQIELRRHGLVDAHRRRPHR